MSAHATDMIDIREASTSTAGFVEQYLPALLNQAAHLVIGDFADVVRGYGLSIVEWRVLAILADGDRVPVGLLARKAITKQSTLTRLLDRMAEQGHIVRITAGNDRRLTLVEITSEGRALVQVLMARADEQQRRALAALGPARQQQLEALLRGLISSLEPALPATDAFGQD
ncbi:MAG: MarR family transcriptional regulator [Aquabacterium sp.]|uniref:MarR family winged helix-turn-helix transcriptional regulator n=1 Tax=Aquabacterium sp. TaxID=1872578 RepID=UPI003BB1A4F2